MFFNICKWFVFKLIQLLPWRYANFKPWHDVLVPKSHMFCSSQVLIYSGSLPLHKNDIFLDCNFKTTHILCFSETHFNTWTFNNTFLNIDIRTHLTISVNGPKWYNDYIWRFHNLIMTWNFYIFESWVYCNNIQYKYKKDNSYNSNIQTFNVFLIGVRNSHSNFVGSNVKYLSYNNNWQFQ
jgi:hypothetical protein